MSEQPKFIGSVSDFPKREDMIVRVLDLANSLFNITPVFLSKSKG